MPESVSTIIIISYMIWSMGVSAFAAHLHFFFPHYYCCCCCCGGGAAAAEKKPSSFAPSCLQIMNLKSEASASTPLSLVASWQRSLLHLLKPCFEVVEPQPCTTNINQLLDIRTSWDKIARSYQQSKNHKPVVATCTTHEKNHTSYLPSIILMKILLNWTTNQKRGRRWLVNQSKFPIKQSLVCNWTFKLKPEERCNP